MEKNAFFSNQVRTALCKKEKTFRGIFEKVDEKNSDFSTVQFMLELNLNKIMKNQLSQQICLKIFDSFILYSKDFFQNHKKICYFNTKLKAKFEFDENDSSKVLKINLVKGGKIFTFFDDDFHNNHRIKKILKKRVNLLDFHNNYKGLKLIGKGSFAKVFLARNRINQNENAIKVVSKAEIKKKIIGKELIINEIKIMRLLSHPNIIPLEVVYETDTSFYLVLPLLKGGNLKEHIIKSGHLSESESGKILRAILKALSYLHSLNIMHRDMKPDNVLFKSAPFQDSDIFLADFGLAAYTGINKCSIHRCGTPGFIAPEILNKTEDMLAYDTKCDIYSLGIIFFAMLSGRLPFPSNRQEELLVQNAAGFYDFNSYYFANASMKAKKLFFSMIEKDPNTRISAAEALTNDFFISASVEDDIDDTYSGLLLQNITNLNKRKVDFLGVDLLNNSSQLLKKHSTILVSPDNGKKDNIAQPTIFSNQSITIVNAALTGNINSYISSNNSLNGWIEKFEQAKRFSDKILDRDLEIDTLNKSLLKIEKIEGREEEKKNF